ncbi:MAG TPA: hypothetical protein VMV69_26465 [Pirellulales bacterium]|nr:hypothetical protein [Pirellulales bacterium]
MTDAKTGAAIEGARVSSFPGFSSVVTDASGRFTLRGCPKSDEYRLFAHPPVGECYLAGSRTTADVPGLDALETELHIYPAIPVTGLVTEQVSGRPVAAHVVYFPLYPNPHVVTGVGGSGVGAVGSFSEGYTNSEGTFSLAVLPGPGCLGVHAVGGEEFEPAQVDAVAFFEKARVAYGRSDQPEGKPRLFICIGAGGWSAMPQSQFHGIALLNVADGATKLTQDIGLKSKTE